jgi:hypothetical protein
VELAVFRTGGYREVVLLDARQAPLVIMKGLLNMLVGLDLSEETSAACLFVGSEDARAPEAKAKVSEGAGGNGDGA